MKFAILYTLSHYSTCLSHSNVPRHPIYGRSIKNAYLNVYDLTFIQPSQLGLQVKLLGFVWLDGMIDGMEWSFYWNNHACVLVDQKSNKIVISFGMAIH